MESPDNRVQAFLAAGHVCSVMGTWQYGPKLVEKYRVPIVVTGFEPLDVLNGHLWLSSNSRPATPRLENGYRRAVEAAGNVPAQKMLDQVFCGQRPQVAWHW
ncbi:MAG: hypothetical protein R2932_16780 [Caldilineaceae bacterium]